MAFPAALGLPADLTAKATVVPVSLLALYGRTLGGFELYAGAGPQLAWAGVSVGRERESALVPGVVGLLGAAHPLGRGDREPRAVSSPPGASTAGSRGSASAASASPSGTGSDDENDLGDPRRARRGRLFHPAVASGRAPRGDPLGGASPRGPGCSRSTARASPPACARTSIARPPPRRRTATARGSRAGAPRSSSRTSPGTRSRRSRRRSRRGRRPGPTRSSPPTPSTASSGSRRR